MLLAAQMNAWRLTRQNVEDRAHLGVTPCCSVPTAESSCAITKKRLGVEQTHLWQMLLLQLQVQQRTPRQFISYDFESMLLHSGTHRLNLIVAQSICEWCSVHVHTCSTCSSQCALCDKWNDDGTHFDHPPCTIIYSSRAS